MKLADKAGRFLYELRPDLMPYGFLTELEMELWGFFYKERTRPNA